MLQLPVVPHHESPGRSCCSFECPGGSSLIASANVHAVAACTIAACAMMQAETHSQMLFPGVHTLLQASAADHEPNCGVIVPLPCAILYGNSCQLSFLPCGRPDQLVCIRQEGVGQPSKGPTGPGCWRRRSDWCSGRNMCTGRSRCMCCIRSWGRCHGIWHQPSSFPRHSNITQANLLAQVRECLQATHTCMLDC